LNCPNSPGGGINRIGIINTVFGFFLRAGLVRLLIYDGLMDLKLFEIRKQTMSIVLWVMAMAGPSPHTLF
jgi:hypothetical protein